MAKDVIKIDYLIVGSGFSGLCMGVKLCERGLQDRFLILEKASDLGGTWRENVYPGARCDIPHSLYSYSFEKHAGTYTSQQEILDYLHFVADNYHLNENIRYDENVARAEYISNKIGTSSNYWTVETTTGGTYVCQFLILALGQLSHPKMPSNIPGLDTFQGRSCHTAQWDPSIPVSNARIGVVGTGASAIQVIGEVAKVASHVEVFQRTAFYVSPDFFGTRFQQRIGQVSPWINNTYRFILRCFLDFVYYRAVTGKWPWQGLVAWLCKLNLFFFIRDGDMRKQLTPTFPFGARRTLASNEYYSTLTRRNVTLNTSGIERITKTGIIDKTGKETQLDSIVYATGFKTFPYIQGIDIVGTNNQSLDEHWSAAGSYAFYGIMTHGFPNLFLLYGPGTNLGHTSVLEMIEPQVDFVCQLTASYMRKNGVSFVEVKKQVEANFVDKLDAENKKTPFSKVQNSWYIEKGGRVARNWYGSVAEYRKGLAAVDIQSSFEFF